MNQDGRNPLWSFVSPRKMVPAKAEAAAVPSTFSLESVLTVLRGLGFTSARVLPTESSRTTGVKPCSIKRALASSLRLGLVARQLRSDGSSPLANLSCKWGGSNGLGCSVQVVFKFAVQLRRKPGRFQHAYVRNPILDDRQNLVGMTDGAADNQLPAAQRPDNLLPWHHRAAQKVISDGGGIGMNAAFGSNAPRRGG